MRKVILIGNRRSLLQIGTVSDQRSGVSDQQEKRELGLGDPPTKRRSAVRGQRSAKTWTGIGDPSYKERSAGVAITNPSYKMMKTDNLEHINCPICDRDETEELFNKDALSVVVCKRCQLRYVNPRINRQTLEAGYIETYYPPDKVERIHTDSMEWLQMTERLSELEQQRQSKGRLLDVGCGIGTFLHLAREQGWESHGVDPSESGSAFAQEMHKLDVKCGEVFDAGFPSAHFDAITLYHVLEHVPELNPLLSELHRVLKPQTGTLVVEVPNGEGLQSRLQKADWPYVHPHDHLYYFSARSLPKLLRKHGFQDIKLGKPKRVGPTDGIGFTFRQAATAALVQFHLGTVIRVYAS